MAKKTRDKNGDGRTAPLDTSPLDTSPLDTSPLDSGLYVVATPIGNARDITLRALDILARVDLILCEDTRITRNLMQIYQIATPLKAYHDHNAARLRPEIMRRLCRGAALALVSDAGTPLISDPGFRLVEASRAQNIPLFTVPGASAPIAALSISGLPTDRFYFAGFLPPRASARRKVLSSIPNNIGTIIVFEAPSRLSALLRDIADVLGARGLVVARELTKKFEEVKTGSIGELVDYYAENGAPKGELVVLIAPQKLAPMSKILEKAGPQIKAMDALLHVLLPIMPLRQIAVHLAEITELKKNEIYARAIALKSPESNLKRIL